MATKTIVKYLDGTTASVAVSMFDTMQAEKYGRASGWGPVQEAPVESYGYATYFALRRANQLADGQSFDDWAQTVEGVDQEEEPAAPLPDGLPAVSLS